MNRFAFGRIVSSVCVPALLSLAFLGLTFAAPLQPRLEVVNDEGKTRVFVQVSTEEGVRRVLLRETTGKIEARRTGGDPAGAAAFAAWNEIDGKRWTAYSRDGGRSWSKASPLKTDLRLHDGATHPGQAMPPVPGLFSGGAESSVFLVQFRTVSLPEWRAAVEAAGGEILAYFPHNAHLVRIPRSLTPRLVALDFVERVEPYEAWYRLDAAVRAWITDDASAEESRRLRVMAFEWGDVGKRRIADHALSIGAQIAEFWPSGQVIEIQLNGAQAKELATHDDVLWMDFWSERETDMDIVREDSGANFLENDSGYTGQGVRGEVMDNGLDGDHQDFDGVIFHTSYDEASHGTKSYGVVFSNGDRDGDGDGQALGHLPDAQGIFADYDALGDRFAHTQELKESPYFASFQTNSWGNARTTSYTSISSEMDDIIFRLDIAILQSQSNAGTTNSRPQAWAKNIISVGAVQHKNTATLSDDCWCSDASIGPAADGRIKPDILYWNDSIYTTNSGGGYGNHGGTSASTPESAGVLGLMVQMWSENVWGTDPVGTTVFERQPHHTTIKALMVNNAEQYAFSGENHDLTRVHQGWGKPNVRLAKERAPNSFVVDWDDVLQVGETVSYEVDVPAGESELKVTMIYPDPAGTTSASLHRINDLNLKVTSPSGTIYHGNVGLKAGTESTPGGSPNGVDTVENVFVLNPETGIWMVEIEAAEVNQDGYLETPEDDVVFSLVVTGGTGSVCVKPTVDFTITPNPARVGQSVLFDSTVSGGAGGPFEYAWDFNDDGATDSTLEDPSNIYNRPYEGLVRLRVRDAENCPETVEKSISVTGPDLRFEAQVNLTEVDGNGNGAVDPGEIFDIDVQLRNIGNETAVGVNAKLVVDVGTPGPVSLLADAASYGDMAVDFVATSATPYRFQVGQDFPCGQDILFTITQIESADPANVYPDEVAAVRVLVGGSGPAITIYQDGFESDLGWSSQGGGEWEIDFPRGLGGTSGIPGQGPPIPDPDSALEGTQVLGNDLSGQGNFLGDYEAAVDSTITSPPIDFSNASGISMSYYRWLNVAPFDTATMEVSPDGQTWTTLFSENGGVQDDAWLLSDFDVSSIADGAAAFRLRFGLTTDGGFQASGWNIDDLSFSGVTKDSCEPVSRAVPGASSQVMVTRDGGGNLNLSWNADCGGGTAFGIYRGDLVSGYASLTKEAGRCAVAGTSTTIPEGAGQADFFLVVPNDSGFEGSYGADSTGLSRAPAMDACLPRDRIDACAP